MRIGGVVAFAWLAAAWAVGGCSGSSSSLQADGGAPDSQAGHADSGGVDAADDQGKGSSPPLVGGDGSIDSLCQSMGSSACMQCCQSNHSGGLQTYDGAILACACGAGAACASDCATTYCMHIMPAVGSTCGTCLNTAIGGSCASMLAAACQGDPDCVDLQNGCLPGCPK